MDNKHRRGDRALYACIALPSAIGAASLALQAAGAGRALRYQRDAILDGEWWRLLSGQLVHLGWTHLWLNLAALALISLLFARTLRLSEWLWIHAAAFLGTGLGLLAFSPGLQWYVGLSGALHGLFAGGALISLRRGERGAWLLLIALLFKLAWERLAGSVPGSSAWIGGEVITEAHLYGAVAGLVAAAWLARRR